MTFTEGRLAGKSAVRYVRDLKGDQPQLDDEVEKLKQAVFQPMENHKLGRNETVAGTVPPSYLLPLHGLQRLEKLMDEYVGGYTTSYITSDKLLLRGLELIEKE